jgi:serine/threonine protein kinase
MAPELLAPYQFGRNGRTTFESDVFAFGMVLYEARLFWHLPD